MTKILYRDQPFFVDVHLDETYSYIGSYVGVYVERTGFWKFMSKYRCVSSLANISREKASSRKTLIKLLEEAYQECYPENVIECINCSPEITSLYRKR